MVGSNTCGEHITGNKLASLHVVDEAIEYLQDPLLHREMLFVIAQLVLSPAIASVIDG